MNISINRNGSTPLYVQIKHHIEQKILARELLKGFRLPPERVLAAQLSVHRNTVIKAYTALIEDGFVEVSAAPRGYFVCHSAPDTLRFDDTTDSHYGRFDYMVKEEFVHLNKLFNELFQQSVASDFISFAAQLAAPDTYPKEIVREIFTDLLAENSDSLYGYCPAAGLDLLRSEICKHLAEREIRCLPSEVQIVTESSQALDYLFKLYMKPGDSIIVEEPILTDTFDYFRLMGIRTIAVPMDSGGIIMSQLEEAISRWHPKFIYTVPNFHNPTGKVMSLERRYELLKVSYKYRVPIIEEDCDYELRYDGPSLPPLYAIDSKSNVVYVDSFIFSLFPGARIAYMVAPKQVASKVSKLVDIEQIFIGSMMQRLTYEFMARGYYNTHREKLRSYYMEKRDAMCEALQSIPDIAFEKPEGGTCLWCRIPQEINQTKLLKCAHSLGVSFVPGFLFFPYGNRGENYIRLSFSDVRKEDIEKGVQLIGQAINECREELA